MRNGERLLVVVDKPANHMMDDKSKAEEWFNALEDRVTELKAESGETSNKVGQILELWWAYQ
jgi:hypothetical protein